MKNRKIKFIILFGIFVLVLVGAFAIHNSRSKELKVVFFDVGQGDAIMISQGSVQVLIDGGKSGQLLLEKLGKHVPFWDRKIEAVIFTHPDQDHIGGFAEVFKNYEVGTVIKTNAVNDSKTFMSLEEFVSLEGSQIVEAKKGLGVEFPGGQKLEIIYPLGTVSRENEDTNSSSVTAILYAGKERFLFDGDLPSEKEDILDAGGEDLDVDVLKVSHHGSRYSTSDKFVGKTTPKKAIISVGKNSYGHPSEEVVQRLKLFGVKILRTDEIGDIIFKCFNLQEECVLQN